MSTEKSFVLNLENGRKIGVEGETIHAAMKNAGLTQDALRSMGFVSFALIPNEIPLVELHPDPC